MKTITLGLMSGTSLDGVDAVAVDFQGNRIKLLGHHHVDYDASMKSALLELSSPGNNEIDKLGDISVTLANLYAQTILELLDKTGISRSKLLAAGIHGQTVRHRPGHGWSLQLNYPALVSELTGLDIVSDFRARDLAAGGEGAPLVPAFHNALFRGENPRAVVNIGGIANITILPSNHTRFSVNGYDCGPGNMLMDIWCKKHLGTDFDVNGTWAESGRVSQTLLARLLSHPYFSKPAPKSTGREDFNLPWLEENLGNETAENVQATLLALTATGIANAVKASPYRVKEVFLCGGGALNPVLVTAIQGLCGNDVSVYSTEKLGVHPIHVEAMAFAWLTWAYFRGIPGNIREVTHAAGPRVLGTLTQH